MEMFGRPAEEVLKSKNAWFFFAGCGMLFVSLVLFLNTLLFLASAASAPGHVVDIVIQRDGSDEKRLPVVEFRAESGQRYRFTRPHFTVFAPSYEIGDVVEVLYRPKSPLKVRIREIASNWGLSFFFAFMGGGFAFTTLRSLLSEGRIPVPKWLDFNK